MGRRKGNANDAPSKEWLAAVEGMAPPPPEEPEPRGPDRPCGLEPIPASFLAFCDLLKVILSKAQRVACMIAFDGVEPARLEGEERDLAIQMFGDIDIIPILARTQVIARVGARAGKTYVLGALRLLHLALTVPLTRLAPGERAFALMVATDLNTAEQALRFAEGAAKSCGRISPMIAGEKGRSLTIEREDGTVSIECFAASTRGSSLRGRWYVGAFLDEFAFFRTKEFKVNDADVLEAVGPRVMSGGQLIVSSTPDIEAGLFHEICDRNQGHPVDFIALHAPTLLFRGEDRETRDHVERGYILDALKADNNFGANFLKSSEDQFFAGWAVDAACRGGDPQPTCANATAGIDLAFQRDSSALVVTERQGGFVAVTDTVLQSPTLEKPLVPSEIMADFSVRAKRKGCHDMVADSHHWSSALEHATAHKMGLVAGPSVTGEREEAFLYVRNLLREGRLLLPPGDAPLLNQMKSVRARPKAGGGLDIDMPRKKGDGHADLVAALVNAVWFDRRFGPVGSEQVMPCAMAGGWEQW